MLGNQSEVKLKKIIIITICVLTSIIYAQSEFSSLNSKPGSFSRMGFGARGMGMGNAMSAVIDGNIVTYYNPALSVYQKKNSFQTSYTFMTLDRSLNFVSFTKKFRLKSGNSSERFIGFSIGLINSGVSEIPGYGIQGNYTGELSTSENQFFLALANKFSEKFTIGVTFKYLYNSLYQEMTTSGIGVDIGAIYRITNNLTAAFTLTDLNSKYSWDSSDLYGLDGKQIKDKFPLLTKLGLSYSTLEKKLLVALDFEKSNAETNIVRIGAEYLIHENLYVRAGCDRIHLENFNIPVRPSLGFSYFYELDNSKIGIDYAFVVEPYSSGDLHIVGVNFNF